MHSHHYLGDDPALFDGKRVVVLGMGNSAMDIAVEADPERRAGLPGRPPRRLDRAQVRLRPPAGPVRHRPAHPARGPPALHARRRCAPRSARWSATACPRPTTARSRRTRRSRTRSSPGSRTATSRVKPNLATLTASTVSLRGRQRGARRRDRLRRRATRSASRSSTRRSSPRPRTSCRCSGASFIPTSRACTSSRCCSRWARRCRWPRRSRSGSATT